MVTIRFPPEVINCTRLELTNQAAAEAGYNEEDAWGAQLRSEARARAADRVRRRFFSSRLAYARTLTSGRAGTLLWHLPRRAPPTGRARSGYSGSCPRAYRVAAIV